LARGGHGDPIGKYPQYIMPKQNEGKPQTAKRIKIGKSEK